MQRVFVLDYEIVSPLGVGKEAVWSSILDGYLAGRRIGRFEAGELPVNSAAEVTGNLGFSRQDLPEWVDRHISYDRSLELLVACWNLIAGRARDYLEAVPATRAGLCIGSGQDIPAVEILAQKLDVQFDRGNPVTVADFLHAAWASGIDSGELIKFQDVGAAFLASDLGLEAFNNQYLTACSASNQAAGFAYRAIQQGSADIVVAAGADSVLNMIAYNSLAKLGIFIEDERPPEKTCRPLDMSRRGTLIGEAAGIVLLASEALVESKGWKPEMEIVGSGNTLDGYKITSPDPDAKGMSRAIRSALQDASVAPGEIDYIQLHGTGTVSNDPLEIKAIADVFQDATSSLAVSSTKDRHGHAVAAAGIQELIILFEAMRNNLAPCTANLDNPIESHGIELVRGENKPLQLDTCLNHSFAFGGINSVVVVKKVT